MRTIMLAPQSRRLTSKHASMKMMHQIGKVNLDWKSNPNAVCVGTSDMVRNIVTERDCTHGVRIAAPMLPEAPLKLRHLRTKIWRDAESHTREHSIRSVHQTRHRQIQTRNNRHLGLETTKSHTLMTFSDRLAAPAKSRQRGLDQRITQKYFGFWSG